MLFVQSGKCTGMGSENMVSDGMLSRTRRTAHHHLLTCKMSLCQVLIEDEFAAAILIPCNCCAVSQNHLIEACLECKKLDSCKCCMRRVNTHEQHSEVMLWSHGPADSLYSKSHVEKRL